MRNVRPGTDGLSKAFEAVGHVSTSQISASAACKIAPLSIIARKTPVLEEPKAVRGGYVVEYLTSPITYVSFWTKSH